MEPLSLLMIGALALLVMFMVRNSKKQRQSQMMLQEKLQPGAEVMTSFGLFAHVITIDDETNVATIDAGGGTTLRVHRQTLTKVVDDEQGEPDDATDEQEPTTQDKNES